MQQNAYHRMCHDCEFLVEGAGSGADFGSSCGFATHPQLQQVFIEVNVEIEQSDDVKDINENRALMRFEFIEVRHRESLISSSPSSSCSCLL